MAKTDELVIAMGFGDAIRVVTRNTIFPMRSNSWFGKFWTRLRTEVVQDVPPSLEECESCREVSCTQERWRNRFPQAIVDAFEAEGFIWGGRWYHYDTMHFEYRPELFG